MNNKKHTPPIVRLLMITMITAFAWVGFEVYRAFTVKPPPVVAEEILSPISPLLDSRVLDKLQQRVHINDSDIAELPIEGSVILETPEPTPNATDATESAELQNEEDTTLE